MHSKNLGPSTSKKIMQCQVVNGTTHRYNLEINKRGGIEVRVAGRNIPLKRFVLKQDYRKDVVAVNKCIPGIYKIVDKVNALLPLTHQNMLRADVIV